VTDELRALIPLHKRALIDLLTDEAERFEERAAIREYDGGLSRPAAERLARRDVARSDGHTPVTLDGVRSMFDAELVGGAWPEVLSPDEEREAIAEYARQAARAGRRHAA
jgi:hypothetical protein